MSNFIPAQQLSFDQYKNSLKTFMRSQERFKDIDFEGSNIAVLIDLLSYNAFNQGYYLNMIGSEMFLDTAQLRESIVSRAKELNYVPRSRVSSRMDITVEISPNDSPNTITIPQHYMFKSTSSKGNSIRFNTDKPITLVKNSFDRYVSDTFTVYEGVVASEVFTVANTITSNNTTQYSQVFNLQSANIDISSIQVYVYKGGDVSNRIDFTRADDLYGLTNVSKVYFVTGYKDNYYRVEFGDGILGYALSDTDVVHINYRSTLGEEGNGTYTLSKSSPIDGYTNITTSTITKAVGGADRENDQSIKYNAVKHFQAQNRAVNEEDFRVLIENNFPEIQDVSVYGGEVVNKYGKVIIVLKPHNVEGIVNQSTKDRIISFLRTKTLVPQPIIEDPEYYYIGISGNVYYNPSYTSNQATAINSAVVNRLVELNNSVLSTFNTTVYQSTVNESIKVSENSIVGSDVKLTLVRKLIPSLGINYTYSFTLDNQIKNSTGGAYTSTDYYGVSSNVFKTIVDDQVVDSLILDNGIGNLHLYVIVDGLKTIQPISIGTVDYTTGKITFTIDIYQTASSLKVYSNLVDNSIVIQQNKFITINGSDINLVMVPV